MSAPLTRRTLLKTGLAVGAVSATGSLTSCSGSGSGPAKGLEARNELRIGVQTLPDTLDANGSVSNSGIQAYHNIYDTLIMRDTHSATVEFKPGLAEKWERVEDLVWEFTLRSDVKFHDGTTMTAADVVYSLSRVIEEKDPSYATAHAYLLSNVASVEATNDTTVKMTTKKPEPLMEHLLSDANGGISSMAYTTKVGIDKAAIKPITTGPYKVTEFVPDVRLVLEGTADHWSGEQPPYKKITYLSMPEIASRITALKNDEVDMITNIPPDQEQLLEGDDRLKLVGEVLELYHVYRFNMSNPAVDDARLRAALDYGIDRGSLTKSIWNGKAEEPTSYQFTTYDKALQFPDRQDIRYDPEKAKRLVKESDYAGEMIEIYNTRDYYTYGDLAAQAICDMWADIGVQAKLVQVDSVSDANDKVLEFRTWSNPLYYNDPMGVIERHWAPKGPSVTVGHFKPSAAYNKLFETARYSLDKEKRAEALAGIFDYFRAETPFIYLYKPYESLGLRANIDYVQSKNLRPYTLSFRAGDVAETST